MFSSICAWINGWTNNREAGDFRRQRSHHDVTVMQRNHYNAKMAKNWPLDIVFLFPIMSGTPDILRLAYIIMIVADAQTSNRPQTTTLTRQGPASHEVYYVMPISRHQYQMNFNCGISGGRFLCFWWISYGRLTEIRRYNYNDVTWTSWRLHSPVRLLIQWLLQLNINENTKAPHRCPLFG